VVSAADITADIDQRAANFDAVQASKTLTTACGSASPNQLKMNFAIHAAAGVSIPTVSYRAFLNGTEKGSSQSTSVAEGQSLNINFYNSPYYIGATYAGDTFYVEITTPGCHLGPFPSAKRAYASSCQDQTPIDIYCDGKTMAGCVRWRNCQRAIDHQWF
jgi:hypothetical protein